MELTFPTSPQEAGPGKLITFLSSRPGAGSTTLACMTAITAAQIYDTALVDFTAESKVRSYMGYQEGITSVSILDINSVASPDGVFSASEQHHKNIKVFPGVSTRIMDASQIDSSLMLKAVTYLKQSSPLTIAVINQIYNYGWVAPLLSDMVCVTVRPDRPCMDSFRDTMDFLARLDAAERTKILLNQQGYPGCVEPKGAAKFYNPDAIVNYDKHIAMMCNQREINPDSKIRNALLKLLKEGGL